MKINPNFDEGIVNLPAQCVNAVCGAGECELRVLILAMADCRSFDVKQAAKKLGINEDAVISALEFWKSCGALKFRSPSKKDTDADKPAEGQAAASVGAEPDGGDENMPDRPKRGIRSAAQLPKYTSGQITSLVDGDSEMRMMIDYCQQSLGKMFNTAEVEILVGLADFLTLDKKYVMLLVSYCAKNGKKSLRYIEKLAIDLFDKGVMTYPELEEHLRYMELAGQSEQSMRKLFGIGRRALTKKETDAFLVWCGKYEYPMSIIERAYEITVDNTGGVSIPYTGAILERWYTSGYKTTEDIDRATEEYRHNKENATVGKGSGSFDTDDFFEAALKRSYGE